MPKMQATSSTLVCLSLSLHAASAAAQSLSGGITIKVSNTITPAQPSAMIEFWGWFTPVPGTADLFSGVNTTVSASEPGWNASSLGSPSGILHSPINPVGGKFQIIAGQPHFPPAGVFGNPSNPLLLFWVEWSATSFSKRTIDLTTDSKGVGVVNMAGVTINIPPGSVSEGSAEIHVVPSPAPLALLCLAPLLARRRRA